MSDYIETDPTTIEVIKRVIDEKWNPICMGYHVLIDCPLCLHCSDCDCCPLAISGNNCNEEGSSWGDWDRAAKRLSCGHECNALNASCGDFSECPKNYAPAEAEAMLEALVQLLPPEHREEYGG